MTLALIALVAFLASPLFFGPALALLRLRAEAAAPAPEPHVPEAPAPRRALPPAA